MFKEHFKEGEKLVTGPDYGLTLGQTDRLTVGRKITLTYNLRQENSSQLDSYLIEKSDVYGCHPQYCNKH
jgi:hypothetical protein